MIYIGADHGGFELKKKVKTWLEEWGYDYQDIGNRIYDIEDDYPKYAIEVAKRVAEDEKNRGILICRSAVGMVIAANKIKGIRAAAVYDEKTARLCREHNDANIIGLSGDRLSDFQAKKILKIFLETEFSDEARHKRRVEQIGEIEEKKGRNKGLMKALMAAAKGFSYNKKNDPLRRKGASNFLGRWDKNL